MSMRSDGKGTLFLALKPDDKTAARACALAEVLKSAHRFRGAVVQPDQLHITLFYLGEYSAHLERLACAAAEQVRDRSFPISFDRTASFGGKNGKHSFVLTGDEAQNPLRSFRQALGVAMTKNGLGRMACGSFTPHMTLMYGQREVEENPVEPISWTATEFVLVHSLRGHRHLGRWSFDV